MVTYFYMVRKTRVLAIENTLMVGYGMPAFHAPLTLRQNVLGTVLGFVIGYRSSASFERYNEVRSAAKSTIDAVLNSTRVDATGVKSS